MRDRHQTITQCYLIPGRMWPVELCWLYDNLRMSRSHVEIGTYCGRSLVASCGAMHKAAVVYAVDSHEGWVEHEWMQSVHDASLRLIEQKVVTLHMNSIDASRKCMAEGIRFQSIFIDGCHEWAECKADIEAWAPLIIPGGIICGHDYWAVDLGVMEAVNEAFHGRHEVVPGTRIWHTTKS